MTPSKRTKSSANAVETLMQATKSAKATTTKMLGKGDRLLYCSIVFLGIFLSITCSVYGLSGSLRYHTLIVPSSHVRVQLPSDIVRRLQAGETLIFRNASSNNTRQPQSLQNGETQIRVRSNPPMAKANYKRLDVRDQMRLHRQKLHDMEQARSLSSNEMNQKLKAVPEPLPVSNPARSEHESQSRFLSHPNSNANLHRC